MSVAPRLKAVPDIALKSMSDEALQAIVDAGTRVVRNSSVGDLDIVTEQITRTEGAKDALAELTRRRLIKQ